MEWFTRRWYDIASCSIRLVVEYQYRFLIYRNGRGMHQLLTPGWYFVLALSQGEQQNEPQGHEKVARAEA
jgi:hypothetical protein